MKQATAQFVVTIVVGAAHTDLVFAVAFGRPRWLPRVERAEWYRSKAVLVRARSGRGGESVLVQMRQSRDCRP